MRRWSFEHEGTTGWNAMWRVGRLEIGYHLYRHRYPGSSDRWVLQPQFIYDRRRAAT